MSRNIAEPSLGVGTMSQGDTAILPGSTAGDRPHYHPSEVVSSLCYHPNLVVVRVACPANCCIHHLAGW
jgi:hypothetical protein